MELVSTAAFTMLSYVEIREEVAVVVVEVTNTKR